MSDADLVFQYIPGLFLTMLLFLAIGRRLGMRWMADETERERIFLITVQGAIYGLLGLLLAFMFSGAASRFEARRLLTVQEANAIGTAYLRLSLLPAAAQPALRDKLRLYGEARLAVFRVLPDRIASDSQAARATVLQQEIWNGASAALLDAAPTATLLLLPALNEMIDFATTRAVALRTHTPTIILAALAILAWFCSLLVGYGLAGSNLFNVLLHMVGFAFIITATMYVIVDLDNPRVGLIRLDFADDALVETIAGMK